MRLRREAFWALVLAVIAIDLWWSSTPMTFEIWWIPLLVLNVVCLAVVLFPVIAGRN